MLVKRCNTTFINTPILKPFFFTLRTSANRYSNDSASLARSDPFYRDTSVNIATSGAREFSPEKRESYSSYDYSPKESGYGSSSVNLR